MEKQKRGRGRPPKAEAVDRPLVLTLGSKREKLEIELTTTTREVVSRLMWKLATAPLPDAWLGLCSTIRYAAASSSRETTSTIFS